MSTLTRVDLAVANCVHALSLKSLSAFPLHLCLILVRTHRIYLCTDYRPRMIARQGACGRICPHMHSCLCATSARSRSGLPHDALHRTVTTAAARSLTNWQQCSTNACYWPTVYKNSQPIYSRLLLRSSKSAFVIVVDACQLRGELPDIIILDQTMHQIMLWWRYAVLWALRDRATDAMHKTTISYAKLKHYACVTTCHHSALSQESGGVSTSFLLNFAWVIEECSSICFTIKKWKHEKGGIFHSSLV